MLVFNKKSVLFISKRHKESVWIDTIFVRNAATNQIEERLIERLKIKLNKNLSYRVEKKLCKKTKILNIITFN